jgi:hypothetical protein
MSTIHPDRITKVSSRCLQGIQDKTTIPVLLQSLHNQNPSYCLGTNGNIENCKNSILDPNLQIYKPSLNQGTLSALKNEVQPWFIRFLNYCEDVLDIEKEGALLLLKQTPEEYDEERNIYLQRASNAKSYNGWVILLQLTLLIMLILTIGYIKFKGGSFDTIRTSLSLIIPLIIFLYGWFFISGYTVL